MKMRLDQVLVIKQLVQSTAEAQGYILAGKVLVDNHSITKAGHMISENAQIRIKEKRKCVSRGGIKLEAALEQFSLSVDDKVCVDIGTSTGGFTDCLLRYGAQKVYSVDVGKNQLNYSLRQNCRVVSIEGVHANDLKADLFCPRPNIIVIDVSFKSLTAIISHVLSIVDNTDSEIIVLVEPQFEIGRNIDSFKGVVRNPEDHFSALKQVYSHTLECGLGNCKLMHSPLTGPKGNIEFFIYWDLSSEYSVFDFDNAAKKVIKNAHKQFFDNDVGEF